MYETLILVKPGKDLPFSEIESIARTIADTGDGLFKSSPRRLAIVLEDEAELKIQLNDSADVLVESKELAAKTGIVCDKVTVRFEVSGEDPEMDLFNDYMMILEEIHATGKVILIDPVEGQELGLG